MIIEVKHVQLHPRKRFERVKLATIRNSVASRTVSVIECGNADRGDGGTHPQLRPPPSEAVIAAAPESQKTQVKNMLGIAPP